MPFVYPPAARINNDGRYGPTANNKFYVSVTYHRRNARRRPDKTRWIITENAEFFVFRLADESNWFCNLNQKFFSVIDSGDEKLGENGEILSIFWKPVNEVDDWHGHPVFSDQYSPSSDLLDIWETNAVIPYHLRIRIENRKI